MHYLPNRSRSHLTLLPRPRVQPVFFKVTPDQLQSPLDSAVSIQIRTGIGTRLDAVRGEDGRMGGLEQRALHSLTLFVFALGSRSPPVRSHALIHPDDN